MGKSCHESSYITGFLLNTEAPKLESSGGNCNNLGHPIKTWFHLLQTISFLGTFQIQGLRKDDILYSLFWILA